jgi:hypothetical protein
MSAEGKSQDPVISTILHDPAQDAAVHAAHDEPHDHATEVRHAWEHFWENARFFACFLTIIVVTVIAFNVDFGSWNRFMTYTLAAIRSAFIAYFLSHLFKDFSLVFRTLFFTLIFLIGMIFLSLWDSDLVNSQGKGIGNPIWDSAHPKSMHP